MAKKNEEAPNNSEALALTNEQVLAARPDYIKEGSRGQEEVSLRDMVLPRLGLCQTNSRARNKNNEKYIKGLEEGQLFNTLTGEIYGEKVQIVPLFFYHSRIMFRDMNEGGGIICQAPDGKKCQLNNGGPCLHSMWGPKGEPPECNEFFNYPSLVYKGPGEQTNDLIIVSLKTTGLEAGRNLNSMIRMRNADTFAGIYELSSYADKNPAGNDYYTWRVRNGNPPWTDPVLLAKAEKMYKIVFEGLKSGTITVDADDDSIDAFAAHDSEV